MRKRENESEIQNESKEARMKPRVQRSSLKKKT